MGRTGLTIHHVTDCISYPTPDRKLRVPPWDPTGFPGRRPAAGAALTIRSGRPAAGPVGTAGRERAGLLVDALLFPRRIRPY